MLIFKQSLVNFLKGLKYVFTPIGILSLFIIIGFSVLIPGIVGAVTTLINSVATEISTISTDWETVLAALLLFVKGLNWSNPGQILSDLTNQEYLREALGTLLRDTFPGIDLKIAAITGYIQICIQEIIKYIVIFLVLILIGFILGYFVTKWLIRRDITHRKWYKAILFAIVDVIVLVLAIVLGIMSINKFGMNGIWFILLILIVLSAFSLFEGWLIHGVKKVKITKVLNIKNILFLILGNLIVVAAGALTIFLVNLLGMIVLTAVMGLAIVEVTQVVITANAEGYVCYLSNDKYNQEVVKKLKKLEKEREQNKESV